MSTAIRRKGCRAVSSNGIDEKTANKIYDEMIDFAKYAFNKSHAAAYAVVSYQTAWLKYYYPVEFMAALMTSVIDNPGKGGGIYLYLPADGHWHPASGYQRGSGEFLRGRREYPLWSGCHQEHWPAGDRVSDPRSGRAAANSAA